MDDPRASTNIAAIVAGMLAGSGTNPWPLDAPRERFRPPPWVGKAGGKPGRRKAPGSKPRKPRGR